MDTHIYLGKWKNGKFTVFIGAGDRGVLWDADSVDDPSEMEIRILPHDLQCGYLLFNQTEDNMFEIEPGDSATLEEIWERYKKVVWPESRAKRATA